jgi:hypothetical protein
VYGSNSQANAGYFVGNVYATGTITSGSSDIRLKKNVKPLEGALATLLQLRGVTFEWRDPTAFVDQTGTQRGFVAQEVEKVMPEWVSEDPGGFKAIKIPGRGFEALMVESLRTLKLENDALKDRVKVLEDNRKPAVGAFGGVGGLMGLTGLALCCGFVGSRRRKPDLNA